MFDYRLFVPEDVYEVMNIVNREMKYDLSPDVYLNVHNAWPEGFIVATFYHKVVGFLMSGITTDNAIRILLLVIRREFQSKGIGRSLMKIIVKKAMRKRINRITLEVRVKNSHAIAFYRNYGLQIIGKTMGFYRDGGDAYIMEKVLLN